MRVRETATAAVRPGILVDKIIKVKQGWCARGERGSDGTEGRKEELEEYFGKAGIARGVEGGLVQVQNITEKQKDRI